MIEMLLLGASGILGRELASLAGPSALATHFTRGTTPGSVAFDARVMSVDDLLARHAHPPRFAVVMVGITAIDSCARDPVGTRALNVGAVVAVIRRLASCGVRPVFVSSDGVFDGARALSREVDPARPILEYGRQKLEVEQAVLAIRGGLVVRLPKLLEHAGDPRGIVTGWVDALGKPGRILCATDQFFTPLGARDAAAGILALARSDVTGLYHVAGPERLSRRALLSEVVSVYREVAEPRAHVVDCLLGDLPVLERRPLDTSLDSRRFQSCYGKTVASATEVARETVRALLRSDGDSPAPRPRSG